MGSKGRSGIIGFDYVRLSEQDRAKYVAGIILTVSLCEGVSVKSGRSKG